MPVIKYGDREIHYEPYEWNEDVKIFHQDYSSINADLEHKKIDHWGGQAQFDIETQGDGYINLNYALRPFVEIEPSNIPSYDYLIYEGKEKKFPYPDILYVAGIAPNQLIISYRLMGLFQKYRMAPHITAPVVVRHRDVVIDDYYVMVYFWHHGCDLINWNDTIYEIRDFISGEHFSFWKFFSLSEFKVFREGGSVDRLQTRPLSISIFDKYDIFYSTVVNRILVSKDLINQLNQFDGKNIAINIGYEFETISIK